MFDGMMDNMEPFDYEKRAKEVTDALLRSRELGYRDGYSDGIKFGRANPVVAVPAPAEPSGATEQKMPDDVFRAWVGMELRERPRSAGKPMSPQYSLMIYFAVASFHFYRDEIRPAGSTLGDWAEQNKQVIDRVVKEAREMFNYELSHQQIGQAVAAYLCSPSRLQPAAPEPEIIVDDLK